MSKKNKQKQKSQDVNRFDRAQRELSKGNVSEALREAKLCVQQENTDLHRNFLGKAYLARIDDLFRRQFPDQARDLLRELMRLVVNDEVVRSALPRWQILLNVPDPSGKSTSELIAQQPELLAVLADELVLRPSLTTCGDSQLVQQAGEIRGALEAIERGEDEAALERLKEISSQSPFSDWRLFARGLVARYAGQDDRMRANWDRLDAKRAARRIAWTLLVSDGKANVAECAFDVATRLRRLEQLQNAAVAPAGVMESLSRAWKDGNWRTFFQELRSFRQREGSRHGPLLHRIAEATAARCIRERDVESLNRLASIVPGTPFDPHWNRAHALVSEGIGGDATDKWLHYIQDLNHVSGIRDADRPIAKALVHQHIGRVLAARANQSGFLYLGSRAHEGLSRKAASYFEQAITAYPKLRTAYEELIHVLAALEDDRNITLVYKSLLRQFPDDWEAQMQFAEHLVQSDQPGEAEPFIEAAYKTNPRQERVQTLRWNQRMAMVRVCIKKKKFGLAREELARLEQLPVPADLPYSIDLLRAVLEFKAGNIEVGQQAVAAAVSKVGDPLVIWLAMCSCVARYSLSKAVKTEFANRWTAELEKPAYSKSAGHMARYLLPFIATETKYSGMVTQCRQIVAYIQRTVNDDWSEADLAAVLRFLRHQAKREDLMDELTAVGLKQYPDSAFLQFMAGMMEMAWGPFECELAVAERFFQRALELHASGRSMLRESDVAEARRSLSLLHDQKERGGSFFGFAGGTDEDYDVEWNEDDMDGFGAGPAGIPSFAEMMDQLAEVCRATGMSPQEALGNIMRGIDPLTGKRF